MSYKGLIRLTSRGRVIYVAENVLGPAFPDEYKLPRRVSEARLSDAEVGFMEAKEQYLGVPQRQGQKPELPPLANIDMEASVLHASALVYYLAGRPEQGLTDIDALLAHVNQGAFVGHAAEMAYQMSARTKDWDGLIRRMNRILEGGDFSVVARETLLDWKCDGLIQQGLAIAEEGKAADAVERLTSAASTCSSLVERGGEALYQLGQVAERGNFVEQARAAYQRVVNEFGRSRYRNMAQRRLQQLRR